MLRVAALILLFSIALFAQWPAINLHQVAGGFASPTAIAGAPDGSGRLFVLEQPGRVRIIRNGAVLPTPFLTIPSTRVQCCGERGLLGIAFPPEFASKQYVYLTYTNTSNESVVSRGVYRPPIPTAPIQPPKSFCSPSARNQANHHGGGIAFGPDGYLYIGTGDSGGGGDPENAAQNPNELRGKMLRIDTESGQTPYRIPPDQPVRQSYWLSSGDLGSGLRNPWRYSFDRETR